MPLAGGVGHKLNSHFDRATGLQCWPYNSHITVRAVPLPSDVSHIYKHTPLLEHVLQLAPPIVASKEGVTPAVPPDVESSRNAAA